MRALTYQGRGKLVLTEEKIPTIENDRHVLIKIEMTGICGTDHKILAGKLDVADPGTILGHEGVGTVVDVGLGVSQFQAGDRVIINPTQSCLVCRACKMGRYCYCENFDAHQIGFTLPGTFAEYAVILDRWLYKIPAAMSWQVASLIEPLGCSLNTLLKSGVQPYESVLVIGAGPIGMMCQSIASSMAAVVVSSEPNEYRRGFATKVADHAVMPHELTEKYIRSVTGNSGFDVVIDAVGNQLESALTLVNKGGRVVPMGYDDLYNTSLTPTQLIDTGVSIIGAVVQHDAVGPALAMAQGLPALDSLITVEVEMEDFLTAFERTMGVNMATGTRTEVSAMKAVIHS